MAHDFGNMLTVISGHADQILDKLPPGDPLRRGIEDIAQAAACAGGLTRQLLIFSQKGPECERIAISPGTVLRRIETMLRRLVGEDMGVGALAA